LGARQECLTLHRGVVAEFLEAQYEPFFKRYNALLESTNYVTRRLSIKLLGELLLHAESKTVMVRLSGTASVPQ
jgi:calcium binding protein 39